MVDYIYILSTNTWKKKKEDTMHVINLLTFIIMFYRK
jgi:hypothetical protein